MIINGTLKEQLYHYLNSYYYDDYPKCMIQTKVKRDETDQLLKSLNLKPENFDTLNVSISNTCAAFERQGFLRGYEHCLKMMGLIGR